MTTVVVRKMTLVALVLLVSTFLGTSMPSTAAELTRLSLGTSTIGGSFFVWGGAWAKMMSERVGDVNISVEVTGGGIANIQLIEQGKMELAFTTASMAYQGWHALDWAEGKQYRSIRAMFPKYPILLHIYSLDRGNIKSIYDLKDKHVTAGTPGTASDMVGRQLLEMLAIKPKKYSSLALGTAVQALKDGMADAGFGMTGIPGPFMLELETTHKVRHIALPEDVLEAMMKIYPYYARDVIPAGTYKNQERDIPTLAFWAIGVCREDVPEELVYRLTKATLEGRETLMKADPSARYVMPENIVNSTIPLHPGALRYYREIGLDVPDRLIPPESR